MTPTILPGCFVMTPTRHEDERGYFSRLYDRDFALANHLDPEVSIVATTFNKAKGTLRGMHFQIAPFAETKVVRVTRGAIFDVALDLRKESPTYLKWYGETLSADNAKQLYIPKGCAHGYLTLEDQTELNYLLSSPYSPSHAQGVRFDDPKFAIDWPGEVRMIHPRDAGYELMG
jgi:dTDP-4-dehydrorhamnose 3,5-epimerase